MRITQGMLSQQMLFDLQNNSERVSKLQNQVATGQRINSPSDDPIGVGYVMRYSNNVAYDTLSQQNASSAQQYLNYTDTVMSQAGQVMQRARQLAVQGASDTTSAQDRTAISSEVDQLYQQMVNIGNSQYNGKYIFNGEQTTTAPYQGDVTSVLKAKPDTGSVLFDIGDGVQLPVNVSGSTFFGAATTPNDTSSDNAFAVLNNLKSALASNDTTAINAAIGQIDTRYNTMLASQADIGARNNRTQMAQDRLTSLVNNDQTLLANTQDVDMAKAITSLQSAMSVQQASLQVGAKVIMPTLLDFLK